PRIQEGHGLLIRGPDGQPAAVGAVSQDTALAREQLFPGRHVVDTQGTLHLHFPRRRGDPRTVWADGEEPDRRAGPPDLLADAYRCHVPDRQPAIRAVASDEPAAVGAEGQRPHDAGVI